LSDLEELRRKRMQELQHQARERSAESEAQEQRRREFEAQKKQIMMQILTPEARGRLSNLRLTKPEYVEQIELQLIQLAQTGRIQSKITDEQLKELLKKLAGKKRDINITRK
jgi:programmed cell death protein 5